MHTTSMPNFLRLLSQKVHNVNTQSPVLPSDQSGIISPFHHTKKSQIRTILSPDPPLPSLLSARKWELLEGERPGFFFWRGDRRGGGLCLSSPWQQVLPPSPTHFYPEAFFPLLSLLLSDSPISSSSSSSRFPVFSCHILSGEKREKNSPRREKN